MTLTQQHIDDMRHALGLTYGDRAYRNHYCADPSDCASWEELVAAGYATVATPTDWLPYNTYRVTPAGVDALAAAIRDTKATEP